MAPSPVLPLRLPVEVTVAVAPCPLTAHWPYTRMAACRAGVLHPFPLEMPQRHPVLAKLRAPCLQGVPPTKSPKGKMESFMGKVGSHHSGGSPGLPCHPNPSLSHRAKGNAGGGVGPQPDCSPYHCTGSVYPTMAPPASLTAVAGSSRGLPIGCPPSFAGFLPESRQPPTSLGLRPALSLRVLQKCVQPLPPKV